MTLYLEKLVERAENQRSLLFNIWGTLARGYGYEGIIPEDEVKYYIYYNVEQEKLKSFPETHDSLDRFPSLIYSFHFKDFEPIARYKDNCYVILQLDDKPGMDINSVADTVVKEYDFKRLEL